MQLRPAGDNAILLELGDVSAAEMHGTARAVRHLAGIAACIVGHSSLLVIFEGKPDSAALAGIDRLAVEAPPQRQHRLRVQFDGEDFGELVQRIEGGEDAFFARVPQLRLRARFIGFRGGFAYLEGWPAEWAMPRRLTSRPHVLRGTFAIAGTMAGFYPVDSPGGWNLLGHTDAAVEHVIATGDEVVIEPVRGRLARAGAPTRATRLVLTAAEVIQAPLATLVQAPDWTRVAVGLPPGGAFDAVAAALAADAVEGSVEVIECAIAGPRLRMRRAAVIAWCDPQLQRTVRDLEAGEEFSPGRVLGGMRGYLAIGERRASVRAASRKDDRLVIDTLAGPHGARLPAAIECEVTPQLDRVGIRLRPIESLRASIPASMPSCGMQFGTVQLHPDGSLIAMGPEHPVTGGYLQPMTVLTGERWKLAQLMPGERVTLRVGGSVRG
jgi:allophanate hydrolase subunit 1